MVINMTLVILIIALGALVVLLNEALKNKGKNKLYDRFFTIIILFIVHISALILQVVCSSTNISPIYFEYVAYIGGMNFATAIFIMACTYAKDSKATDKLKWLYIIPAILLMILWTNDSHHLFYKEYSVYLSKSVFGPALNFFTVYSYLLIAVSFIILLVTSIRKSGFVSLQTAFIILGLLLPTSVNIIGVFDVTLNVTVYVTPTLFTATSVCFYIAIFKLKALSVIPVTLKAIVDNMSDAFVVISEDGTIADLNKTFVEKFRPVGVIKDKENLFDIIKESKLLDITEVKKDIAEAIKCENTITKEYHIQKDEYERYFEVDFQPVKAKDGSEYVATLILLRDITTAKKDMEMMLKNESLVMLGELAGGVAHDINTPISAIKSGLLMFKSIAKTNDEKMLVERMDNCANKIVTLTNSLRNQIRNIGSNDVSDVNVTAVVKDVAVIINNEIMKHNVDLNLDIKQDLVVQGNSAKLSQVVTNIIVNAVQAYEGKGGTVNVVVDKVGNNAIIAVEDFAGGIPAKIKDSIGKNILTTKGVSGTGFGLYLAYSVIAGSFGGEITFDTEEGRGTIFYIRIPMN